MTVHQDGSRRQWLDAAPIELMAQAEVWLIDQISGRCYVKAPSASVTDAGDVVMAGGPTVRSGEITGYEVVEILDRSGADPYSRELWTAAETGQRLVFVWFTSGDFH